jgi:hypothetical protein
MTSHSFTAHARRRHRPQARRLSPAARLAMPRSVVGAAVAALGLAVILAVAPPTPAHAATALRGKAALEGTRTRPPVVEHFAAGTTQDLAVPASAAAADVTRDAVASSSPDELFVKSGTNADWAKLVLYYGGWPVSDQNVTVMLQWMIRENGADSWWLRNNPLNNGYGSGGGGGLGSYDNLQVAAKKVAENLSRGGGYQPIIDCLAASCPPAQTAQAIWESPWATSHYGNGSRWTTGSVKLVKAPAANWG